MDIIFNFLLKASSGIVLFYIVYWFFLRKETFYTANRWFLVAALIISVMMPIFPIRYSVLADSSDTAIYRTIADTFKNIPVVKVPKSTAQSFNWEQAVLLIYITGAAIFMLRLLTQTVVIIHLMFKYRVKSLEGIRIVENERYGLPFSFFNVVFINPKFHTQENLPDILAHEKVHIRENHWFDLLFIELLTVIFWFNPFIWFFERSIKQNHEYLADKGVLAQGHNTGRYQALLINQLIGMQIIGVTNNLNFALNANRLKMMTKTKTPKIKGYKFVWALPTVALLLFAFAEPDYKPKEITDPSTMITDSAIQKSEKEFVIKGKVVQEDNGEPLPGASIVIKGSTIGTVSDRDGTFTLVDPNPKVDAKTGSLSSEIVVSFVGKETVVNTVTVSGNATENNKFTVKLHDVVILIDTELPPPPPPPLHAKTNNEKKTKSDVPPPPPPVKASGEKKVTKDVPPPPPPPVKAGDEVFYIVEELPEYPGGSGELSVFVNKKAKEYHLKGNAKIGFTVNGKGKVTDIKIVSSDNDKVGKAGAEIASQMPDWTPGKQRGKSVPVKYLMNIDFK